MQNKTLSDNSKAQKVDFSRVKKDQLLSMLEQKDSLIEQQKHQIEILFSE